LRVLLAVYLGLNRLLAVEPTALGFLRSVDPCFEGLRALVVGYGPSANNDHIRGLLYVLPARDRAALYRLCRTDSAFDWLFPAG